MSSAKRHGHRPTPIIYLSPTLGPLHLALADPQGDTSRKLFSRFLWNASVLLAEFIEEGPFPQWNIKDHSVLEVGAGTALASMVACLKGAKRTVVTDYPAEEEELGEISVEGHAWGVINNKFSLDNKGKFETILVADCLWMPYQHANLRKSIGHFLSEDGKACVIASFHTGREKMSAFFDSEELAKVGLGVERIWERDAEGAKREWVEDRRLEDPSAWKRWFVVAILEKIRI
ncbi:hypothetical protein B0J14DRAFT_613713 [Halenospora varia]|nr:hypothetical protein B0J14DRAFT_613713 [Halenospora varia]